MCISLIANRWIARSSTGARASARNLVRASCGILFALCCIVAAGASAQTTCIPFGNGGAYNPGPPQWFSGPGASGFSRFNTWVDDPRWYSSASITYGEGSAPELQLRALFNPQSGSPQYVYLSFWHKAAVIGAPATSNRLYVGLAPTATQPGRLLEVDITTAADTTDSAGARAVKVYPVATDGTVAGEITPTPSWTTDIRVWINQVTDQTKLNPPLATNIQEPNNWAVHIRLPIGQDLGGVTLGSPFSMWFELLQGTPSTPVIAYTWPRSTATQNYYVTGNDVVGIGVPSIAQWPQFILGTDISCQGIDIQASDINVSYPGQTSPLNISTNNVNTFVATPVNKSGQQVASDAIRARFRIANWGIQPGTSDEANPGTANWIDVPGLGSVQQAAGTQIANGAQWTLSGNWTPAPGFFTGKSSHQCIQVELSGPSNLTFLHSSAFRNMRTVPASTFKDTAEVSVIGMPDASTPKRDVYLYLETANMPPEIAPGDVITTDIAKRRVAAGFASRAFAEDECLNIEGSHCGDEAAEAGRVYDLTLYERAKAVAPTYILHGYYDTGARFTMNGAERPILAPMVSFGYFVDHQGPLFGWKPALAGAEQIAPSFYVVRVPNGGKVPIEVSIEALEKHPGGPPLDQLLEWLQWFLVVLTLLLVLVLLVLRRRHHHHS